MPHISILKMSSSRQRILNRRPIGPVVKDLGVNVFSAVLALVLKGINMILQKNKEEREKCGFLTHVMTRYRYNDLFAES
jgi:hypothetical protein